MSGLDDLPGPPVDPRYSRALQRQKEGRRPPAPVFACTPSDLEATGDDGHLGLLWYLCQEQGWTLSERRAGETVSLRASAGGCTVTVLGPSAEERAARLFKSLLEDDPLTIALAAAFWPPPRPPAPIGTVA